MRAAIVLGICAIGCGGTPPAPAVQQRALADAPAAGADDFVVAHVNGHPVWASCVTAQATRTRGDRTAALRDCIDFELLAWTAAARGLVDDPAVRAATRTALVARVVDAYEDTAAASDLQPTYDKLLARALPLMRHPEYRASSYVRIPVPEGAPATVDGTAHDVATKIAVVLAGERGLSDADLLPIARPIADFAGVSVTHELVGPMLAIGLDPPYATTLYGIPEVGRTAGPVRTKWGWDVVLFQAVVPAADATDQALHDRVIVEARRVHFPQWVNAIAHGLGIEPALDPQVDHTLDEAP